MISEDTSSSHTKHTQAARTHTPSHSLSFSLSISHSLKSRARGSAKSPKRRAVGVGVAVAFQLVHYFAAFVILQIVAKKYKQFCMKSDFCFVFLL